MSKLNPHRGRTTRAERPQTELNSKMHEQGLTFSILATLELLVIRGLVSVQYIRSVKVASALSGEEPWFEQPYGWKRVKSWIPHGEVMALVIGPVVTEV